MALVVVMMSGIFGMLTALVALIGFNVSFFQAFVLYVVSSVVPVALAMAGLFLHVQITRATAAPDAGFEATRARR